MSAPRPAAKTLPYRHTFSIGPGLRAGEARPRRPAPRAPQAGENPRISGGFARSPPRRPGAPIHINRLQKNGKYSWNVHCNFSQSSPFCSIMNYRHSRGPGRARAPGGGVGRTFSGQIVPFVHRSRFPSPVFRLPGTRAIPPPGRRRADASFVLFVCPLHAERLRPQAPPGVQHHIGKGECL